MSFYELYNNSPIDLLPDSPKKYKMPSRIFPVKNSSLRKYTNVTEIYVSDIEHAKEVIR